MSSRSLRVNWLISFSVMDGSWPVNSRIDTSAQRLARPRLSRLFPSQRMARCKLAIRMREPSGCLLTSSPVSIK